MTSSSSFVFIVGSPRSGTTLLQNLLNHHPQIAEWYEPYYLWEKFFPVPESDIWDNNYLTKKNINRISTEFNLYRKKTKRPIIVDKTPTNSFNIDIISKIFPEAKFIHIIRDGRDATLSIQKEWKKRADIVKEKNFIRYMALIFNMLKRQRFWRYRFMAVSYELKCNFTSKLLFKPSTYLNKSRWKGYPGWGPRFKGWQSFLETHSILEFNAMQWVKSVEAVLNSWDILPEQNKVDIYYEELIQSPQETLSTIFNCIGVKASSDFYETIPKINKKNFNKWKTDFSQEEIQKIKPILSPLLERLGYDKKYPW